MRRAVSQSLRQGEEEPRSASDYPRLFRAQLDSRLRCVCSVMSLHDHSDGTCALIIHIQNQPAHELGVPFLQKWIPRLEVEAVKEQLEVPIPQQSCKCRATNL
jgi:hypothetical protein